MFKLFMAISAGLYRLSGGRLGGTMGGLKVLLLTTTGRKSGKSYTVPLGLFDWQGSYVIVASNGGRPTHPAWFLNLRRQPQVTIQVMDKVMRVKAEVLKGDARTQAWKQVTATAPAYAGYEKKTIREIPVVRLRTN